MKGRLVTQCCACGVAKGDRDPNEGWWTLVARSDRDQMRGRDFCPSCATGLLVRSDEVQTDPRAMTGLRIVQAKDLYAVLAALRTAGMGHEPRSTMGWRAAEKLAPLVGFTGLRKALQLREFGFLPGERP
jgi:hypothetical protein